MERERTQEEEARETREQCGFVRSSKARPMARRSGSW